MTEEDLTDVATTGPGEPAGLVGGDDLADSMRIDAVEPFHTARSIAYPLVLDLPGIGASEEHHETDSAELVAERALVVATEVIGDEAMVLENLDEVHGTGYGFAVVGNSVDYLDHIHPVKMGIETRVGWSALAPHPWT
jgi:hypothetical protein